MSDWAIGKDLIQVDIATSPTSKAVNVFAHQFNAAQIEANINALEVARGVLAERKAHDEKVELVRAFQAKVAAAHSAAEARDAQPVALIPPGTRIRYASKWTGATEYGVVAAPDSPTFTGHTVAKLQEPQHVWIYWSNTPDFPWPTYVHRVNDNVEVVG